ncbi:hypothetical protein [Gimesia aquarii]|uniref:Uncharacterized protein n=1 Tax=Gimesia aquarii TaxID=2527964 RepID=A0A517VRF1_9PLAN|nr:hypothetical protein [Gimesia aquarii]QDT95529.1 hypothetical protein V144x_09740 [Gimesia aquarii]
MSDKYYEPDHPFLVLEEGGEFQSDYPDIEAAKEGLISKAAENDSASESSHAGEMSQVVMVTHTAEHDYTVEGFYRLHPSVEWREIERMKKEHAIMKERLIELEELVNDETECRWSGNGESILSD